MSEKIVNGRIQHKHDTEANWLNTTDFTPKEGELIIYDKDNSYTHPRLKIGDGINDVNNLPFIGSTRYIARTQSTWSGVIPPFTQTITVTGITANDNPDISPIYTGNITDDTNITIAWESVYRITTSANSITIYSHTPFTTTFSLSICCR